MSRRRRIVGLAGFVAVALGAALIPAGSTVPVSAEGEQPPVVLTPGQNVHIDAAALTVPGYAVSRRAQTAQNPDNCRTIDSSWCDVYPLQMNVPEEDIDVSSWIVLATLRWTPRATQKNVPELGDASTSQYVVRVYYDPPCGSDGAPPCPKDEAGNNLGDDGAGDPYAAASATGTAPPAAVGAAEADLHRKMAVTVAFYFGQPVPYSLDLELVKLDFVHPVDLSGDADIAVTDQSNTPDLSAAPDTPPAAAAPAPARATTPAPAAPVAVTALPAPTLAPQPAFGSGDLGGLNGVGSTNLEGDQLASLFIGKAKAALPPAGTPSGLLIVIFLGLAPVISLVLPTGWMWRRRRQRASPA